jgi:uncharacterized Tic20 family protein
MSLVIALVLMVVVVVPLIGWAVRKDKRRRLEAGGSPGTRTEEVA